MKRFPITIQDNKLIPDNLAEFKEYISSITGKRELIIGLPSEMRSLQANKYFYVALNAISKETGDPVEMIKCEIKYDLGMYEMIEVKNRKTDMYTTVHNWKSSRDLTKEQFSELIEYTIAYGAQRGVNIPSPEEFYAMIQGTNKEIDINKLY